MPDLRHRPVFIVRHDFHDDRRAARSVAFVGKFFIRVCAVTAARAFLDRPFDIVLGHIFFLGRHDRLPQAGIAFYVAAAQTRRQRDFLDDFGKDLAAFGVNRPFFSFDGAPFGMAGHRVLS